MIEDIEKMMAQERQQWENERQQLKAAGWQSLFEWKTLGKWKPSDFPANDKIEIKDGAIHIGMGKPMAGITWSGEPPTRMNYEIELEAMRTEGSDFFCGLTFPVNKDPCTLICGGWAVRW
jgi:hypothetical protein